MRDFARLYAELDETTSTSRKLAALQAYFRQVSPENAAWAVYFLAGGKPRQAVPTKLLRQYATEFAGLDDWLFDECYHAVGDLAETIALILPAPTGRSDVGLAEWVEQRIAPLRGAAPETIRTALHAYWNELETRERFLLTKLIGGGFRVGVSKLLVTRALAAIAAVDSKLIAQRLMGWTDGRVSPTAAGFLQLIGEPHAGEHALRGGQPYPFFLAHPLQADPATLGEPADWLVEWKYDGMRAQLLRRDGQSWLWSRGEDLMTERFPELARLPLPEGTVIDGEILVWQAGKVPAPFADLQKRMGRKTVSARLMADLPVVLVAYDLLEYDGIDIRHLPQHERRTLLEQLIATVAAPTLRLSPRIEANSWQALAAIRTESRVRGVEGLMLKQLSSAYGVGRTKDGGTWWKWKIDPHTIDAVLIYAQAGHGRRASLYTDYTFGVWDDDPEVEGGRKLVPFAKAYSGLTDAEIAQVDAVIRKTTIEKFGPVRSVRPSMVFEIGFEGIAASSRHKAGIAVRFPRILRWREDKTIADADTLATLKGMLA
ncbi:MULTISPECIES: ATP-dependent DNA ligase [unclassified Janthinobacterium]|uniref:ATP-dependent DNA ligase n=1 Tax=unclassified Janthinobacterium TaxID=2610881 RepID=UPI00161746FD|nr:MULTISPECIES: ATP-dependent DNA ligase [unclassified Janthinobacterium]MBB5367315.1 DNA ligase-1 [Janthinobacterium sp. K2C7]MBB5380207.1 DNA ligase-1 [Janthinobacterium sp. K2Li3]MBB5385697.1 DNA ligase-1 [Janthinobacterium sp. K2E3]